jgi:outer membrane protein TolC
MKKISLIVFALLYFSTTALGLTIDEAAELAVKNNNKVRQFSFLTGSQREKVKSQKSEFLPSLDLSYSFVRQERDVLFGTKNTSAFTAEGTYNLFNGFIDKNTLEQEKHQLKADFYQEKAVVSDVVYGAKRAFIGILKFASNLEVAKEGVELLERQKRDSALRFREGLIAKNDLLKVEVELASTRQRLLQAESDLNISRKNLERLMGTTLDPGEPVEEPPPPGEITITKESLREAMYQQRSEIMFLKSLIESDRAEIAAIKGEYLPSVDLALTYGKLGDSLVPDGREGQFVIDEELSGRVTATWNIFNGFRTKHDMAAKEKEMRAREEELKDLVSELDLQLEEAIEKHRISLGKIGVSKDSIKQAEENYRITDNQYREKIATVTDLLDARVFLTRARTEFNTAFYDLMLSVAELNRVIEGELPLGGKEPESE